VCREEGEISLAGFRDRLRTSRKYAQAWLEYADARGPHPGGWVTPASSPVATR
jgi:hypothetical protein